MGGSQLLKKVPGRSLLRPVKAFVMRAPVARGAHHRRWERKWRAGQRRPWQIDEVAPELVEAVESGWLTPPARVLDLGCGEGYSVAWLAQQGFAAVGVDVSETAIARARHLHGDTPGVRFAAVDVSHPDALKAETFDACVDRGCLHGIPLSARPGYATNVARWVQPGGAFLLTMLPGGDKGHRILEEVFYPAFTLEHTSRIEVMARKGDKTLPGHIYQLRRTT